MPLVYVKFETLLETYVKIFSKDLLCKHNGHICLVHSFCLDHSKKQCNQNKLT